MSQVFKKVKEDFDCEHCGAGVIGGGYTNHCPKCLWSKHVDINPGDRAESCMGLMSPEKIEMARGKFVIIHKCQICAKVKRCRTSRGDSLDASIVQRIEQSRPKG